MAVKYTMWPEPLAPSCFEEDLPENRLIYFQRVRICSRLNSLIAK